MLADSLPDKFGNIVIKSYLESQGRTEDSLTVLEKLCYTGQRGMGALDYNIKMDQLCRRSRGFFEKYRKNTGISDLKILSKI